MYLFKNYVNSCSPENTKLYFAGELLQLVKDETKQVRQVAFTSLTNLLNVYDDKYKSEMLLSYYLGWIRSPPNDIYKLLVERFGEIFFYLPIKKEDHIHCLIHFFVNATKDNTPEVREYCAFNFPAVVKCVGTKRYEKHLHASMVALCEDPSVSVRKRISKGFHEIVKLLSDNGTAKLLKNIFFSFLTVSIQCNLLSLHL